MNNIQQDFEDMFGYPYNFSKDDRGEYIHEDTYYLWKGWQRAYHKYHYNVVVELPKEQGYDPDHTDAEEGFAFGYDWALYDVKCVLDAAGVKYE